VARWEEVESEAPELANAARAFLDARVHKVLATLRQDGSPRLSGIEASFRQGDLWFGGMWQSKKALDLLRDPRFALHSGSVDPPEWKGDAKVAGRAADTDPATAPSLAEPDGEGAPPGPYHLFRAEVIEVVLTRLGEPADHLVIEFWREGRGVQRIERA
jgi:Pyridoxamine 5'-phosphate oxidase